MAAAKLQQVGEAAGSGGMKQLLVAMDKQGAKHPTSNGDTLTTTTTNNIEQHR